jgi:hypothetical protein
MDDEYEYTQRITYDPETTELICHCMGPDGPGNELGFFLKHQTNRIVLELTCRSRKMPSAVVVSH